MSSRRSRLADWLRQRAPTLVELADFDELLGLLSPISESALRRLLRETGSPLAPVVAGVDQTDFTNLARTLSALSASYEHGNADHRRLCRGIVITAKDHARLASRNRRLTEAARLQKREMVDWMLVWLENPPAFPLWAELRMTRLQPAEGY